MTSKVAAIGLLVIGTILVVGGIVLAITGTDGPEWVGKSVAIIVGALVALAGGSQVIAAEHTKEKHEPPT